MKYTTLLRSVLLAGGLAISAVMTPAAASGPALEFDRIHNECVQVPGLEFGAGREWAHCQLEHVAFVATVGLNDFYATRYCLGNKPGVCERKAQVLFANRAYRAEATIAHVDSTDGKNEFLDPVAVMSADGSDLLVLSTRSQGKVERRYYTWQARRWVPIDAGKWIGEYARQLPAGQRVVQVDAPVPVTLVSTVTVSVPGQQKQTREVQLEMVGGELRVAASYGQL
jgi:hypothetical protein